MITKKFVLAAVAATSLTLLPKLPAQGISIEIGDRPYYTHGPHYWEGSSEMVWVGGHWSENHHHWVHGHYIREHRRHMDREQYDRDHDQR